MKISKLISLFLILILSGCATTKRVEVLEQKMQTLEKTIKVSHKKSIKSKESRALSDLRNSWETLTYSHSLVLSRMASDFAITDMNQLISETVKASTYITRGIFLNSDHVPFVYATVENPTGHPQEIKPVKDSLSLFCIEVAKGEKEVTTISVPYKRGNVEGTLWELCAAVFVEGEIIGYLRYTVSHDLIPREKGAMAKSRVKRF